MMCVNSFIAGTGNMLEGKLKKVDWKIDYCDSCEEYRKFVYRDFRIADKRYEFYVCEFCGVMDK